MRSSPSGTGHWIGKNLTGQTISFLLRVLTGNLAESWETPDPLTYVFHIRQGVHYALDPDSEASRLVNGRELTADDVVYTYQRNTAQGDFTERSRLSLAPRSTCHGNR